MKPIFAWKNKCWPEPEREAMFGRLIRKEAPVVDIGCGHCGLKKYTTGTYAGIDLEKWAEDVTVCDLNKDDLPDIYGNNFEQIICQGIIEYISDPLTFFEKIQKYGIELVFSYRLYTKNGPMKRNNYSFEAIVSRVTLAGWHVDSAYEVSSGEKIFHCSRYG